MLTVFCFCCCCCCCCFAGCKENWRRNSTTSNQAHYLFVSVSTMWHEWDIHMTRCTHTFERSFIKNMTKSIECDFVFVFFVFVVGLSVDLVWVIPGLFCFSVGLLLLEYLLAWFVSVVHVIIGYWEVPSRASLVCVFVCVSKTVACHSDNNKLDKRTNVHVANETKTTHPTRGSCGHHRG